MTMTLITVAGTALVSVVGAVVSFIAFRRAANNTPEMVANKQADTDLTLEADAEKAIEASDKGDLTAERKGDAE